jgi:drug/metabolite transporter (DMT)-like permease
MNGKRTGAKTVNKVYLVVIFCAFLGGIAQLLLKQGSGTAKGLWGYINPLVFAGLFLYGVSMLIYLWALPQGEVSVIYPLIACSYVFVLILATVFLKEHLTVWKIIGSLGIVASVWVIVR